MLTKDRVNLRHKKSKYFLSIAMFIVLGLAFFLSSEFIFEEKVDVLASPINDEIRVTSTNNVVIYEWVIDKEKGEMRVIIDTQNLLNEYKEIDFEAFQRSDNSQINTEILYQDGNIYVVSINGFDPEFIQIAFDVIGVKDIEQEEIDSTMEQQNEEENEEVNEERTILKTLYNDYRTIENEEINEMSPSEYVSHITKITIENTNEEIKEIKEEIKDNEQEIESENERIQELTEEKIYQTETEQIETDTNINARLTNIESLKEVNEQLEYEIQKLQDKIEKEKQRELESIVNN